MTSDETRGIKPQKMLYNEENNINLNLMHAGVFFQGGGVKP